MGKDTKDRILDEALVSFAENGYKGTNLRDFAAGMGLSKSALYSHYESKEAIWNALIDIVAFCESDKGNQLFEEWKLKRELNKMINPEKSKSKAQ